MASTVIIHGKKVTEQSPRYGRPECDLWGVTRANVKYWMPSPHGELKDWTAWFDTHDPNPNGNYPGSKARRPEQWDWFKTLDGSKPVYLHTAPDPDVPGSVRFPIDDLKAAFPYPLGYWGCTVAEMIGFAMLKGYERIILNGIGVSQSPEHRTLHESILAMIYLARGRGLTVEIEGPSIYRIPTTTYGYDAFGYYDTPDWQVRQQRYARRRVR